MVLMSCDEMFVLDSISTTSPLRKEVNSLILFVAAAASSNVSDCNPRCCCMEIEMATKLSHLCSFIIIYFRLMPEMEPLKLELLEQLFIW